MDETLNGVQRDLLKTRAERDESVRKQAVLESKIEELQVLTNFRSNYYVVKR